MEKVRSSSASKESFQMEGIKHFLSTSLLCHSPPRPHHQTDPLFSPLMHFGFNNMEIFPIHHVQSKLSILSWGSHQGEWEVGKPTLTCWGAPTSPNIHIVYTLLDKQHQMMNVYLRIWLVSLGSRGEEDCSSWQDLLTPTAPSQGLAVRGGNLKLSPSQVLPIFKHNTTQGCDSVGRKKKKIQMAHLDKYEPMLSEDSSNMAKASASLKDWTKWRAALHSNHFMAIAEKNNNKKYIDIYHTAICWLAGLMLGAVTAGVSN